MGFSGLLEGSADQLNSFRAASSCIGWARVGHDWGMWKDRQKKTAPGGAGQLLRVGLSNLHRARNGAHMVREGFSPEFTAPIIERDVLRLRFLEAVLLYYPGSGSSLPKGWPASDLLKAWPAIAQLSTAESGVLYIATRKTESLDDLQAQWQQRGAGPIFDELSRWVKSVNLPYTWMLGAAFFVLARMPQATEPQMLCRYLFIATAQAQGDFMVLPALHMPPTAAAGVFELGPILPRFYPGKTSESTYRAECKRTLDDYILREKRAHRELGLRPPEDAPKEAEHLKWLVARVVGKRSLKAVVQIDADGRVGITGVRDGTIKMADRLGVQLSPVRRTEP